MDFEFDWIKITEIVKKRGFIFYYYDMIGLTSCKLSFLFWYESLYLPGYNWSKF